MIIRKYIIGIVLVAICTLSFSQDKQKIPSEDAFVKMILDNEIEKAIDIFHLVKDQFPNAVLFERETINNLGWEAELNGRLKDALKLFELNIEAYPDHYDTYDSYAEALMMDGQLELALDNYNLSLEKKPDNINAIRGARVLEYYSKQEYMILMRDGVKLYTQVYLPKDISNSYPIMLHRDMYSVGNYGNTYRKKLGLNDLFAQEGFIFVFQDIRGRFMSEGEFRVLRPYILDKKSNNDIDESSDTFDTVEWLLNNIPYHNGKVGMWGGSYSGWLTVMGMIDPHPAIKAYSPGASPSDWWMGDDMHHNGAFRLNYAFDWLVNDARPRIEGPTTVIPPWFNKGTGDGYKFFLDLGPIKNINEKYLHHSNPTWNEYMEHGNYDQYWDDRNILNYLDNIDKPVLNIAGWFDAEDYRGPLSIYQEIEKRNPNNRNLIVIGSWRHGGWHRYNTKLGDLDFQQETGRYFMENIEFPFFMHYLKDKGEFLIPEAIVFETGTNKWRQFDHWPPLNVKEKKLYLTEEGGISFGNPENEQSNDFDEYISDPDKPVPYTNNIQNRQGHIWMVEDHRFAERRTDVLVYETEVLTEDVTIAGSIIANLYFTSTGTDCDWIVKLIDVCPDSSSKGMGGYQMMIAGDVFRSKYRNSYSHPEPLEPNKITNIEFDLLDKFHCFRKGHHIMVQIQSTWFPLIDRNPQKFVDIYSAAEEDFQKSFHRIYRSKAYPSHIKINTIQIK